MAPFDEIAVQNGDGEMATFLCRLDEARHDVASAVGKRLGWDEPGIFRSCSLYGGDAILLIQRGNYGEHVVAKFPVPGLIHDAWRDEKLENEVVMMELLSITTTIPIPKVLRWYRSELSLRGLGPFMILECLTSKGIPLSNLIGVPLEGGKRGDLILNPEINDETIDTLYEELAHLLLQLSRLRFARIGAVSKVDESVSWKIGWQPLTADMNDVVTTGGYPAEKFGATGSFNSAGAYFYWRAQHLESHLYAQRNIAGGDPTRARNQFSARRFFADLIPEYCVEHDTGPFRFFCDNLEPSNIIVDEKTLQIVGVVNLGFANAMPAQYAYDVPWWLLLRHPARWLRKENGLRDFLALFTPRMEQFLRAMERVEDAVPQTSDRRLADRMRESWDDGRF